MKGIIAVLSLMAVLFTSSIAYAESSTVRLNVDNSQSAIEFSYTVDTPTISVKSIKDKIDNLDALDNEDEIEHILKIESYSITKTPVKFSLRLEDTNEPTELEPNPSKTDNEYSVFDYYNFIVETLDGKILYDYKNAVKTDALAKYKDIPLITLNKDISDDSAELKITVSKNKELIDLSDKAKKLDWEIVTDWYSLKNENKDTDTETDIKKPVKVTLNSGTYKVGEDIIKGRYTVTGDANVKVYTEDETLRTNIKLTTDKESTTAVESYVMTLNTEGETVKIDGKAIFTPYSPKKPEQTDADKDTATNTDTASKTDKENPKTGDTISLAIASAIMLMAIGAITVIEYKKKNIAK